MAARLPAAGACIGSILAPVAVGLLTTLGSLTTLAGCGSSEPPKSSPESMRESRDPKLLFERGRDYAKAGDLSRAQEYLVAALDGGYEPKQVLPILLRVCVAAGNFQAAAEYGDRVLQQSPADTHLRFVVASLYQSTGETAKARKYLETCAQQDPKDADVQFALGQLIRDDVKDVVLADKYFRAYVALAPTGPHAEEARDSMMQAVPRDANGVPTPAADAPAAAPASPASSSPSPTTNASSSSTTTTATKPSPRQI